MASHLHNQRILRFLLVLSAVALTIFVYASYSTNSPAYTPAIHLRNTPSSASASEALRQNRQNHTAFNNEIEGNENNNNNNNNDGKSVNIGIRAAPNDLNEAQQQQQQQQKHVKANRKSSASVGNENINFAKKLQKHHREPTIDEVAVADSGGVGGSGGAAGSVNDNNIELEEVADEERFINNDLLEEQYVQNVDNALGNINNSNSAAGNNAAQSHILNAQQQEQQVPADQIANNSNNKNNNIVNNNNNNSNTNNNNLNKILDSDVLIPTSNLQKFIENADKILKNITVNNGGPSDAVNDAGAAPANNEDILSQKPNEANQLKNKILDSEIPVPKIDTGNNPDNNILDNSIETNDEALPPSVVMSIKRPGGIQNSINTDNEEQHKLKDSKPAVKPELKKIVKEVKPSTPKPANATTPHSAYDTAKGILTEHIYESGHIDEQINIEKLCPSQGVDIKLLILITSAPSHAEARLAIRQTWGHYGSRRDVSTAFMLGRTVNETLNAALTQENFIYGDLIRGNFIDSYNNLTLKTVSSLEWVDQHCSSAKYVLKTDDDMFINVPKLLTFLDSHTKEKHVIFGRLAKKWKPIRNKKSKYYVSTDQFAAPIFPPFTTGPAYVLSQDTIHELFVRSLNQVYLKLEDVFTTGIVAQQLGVKRVHVNEFLNRRIAFNPCNIRKTISVHMIKANEQFDLWKKLLDQTTKCK